MYLPNKITNILSKITKSYTVKYTNGKIESVFINEKDVMIQASNKGYCIYLKGGPIYLNDLKSIEPLLIKMNVLNNDYKSKHNKSINDDLIDIFSKNKDTFSVKYSGACIVSLNLENPKLVISKTSVGYSLNVNNENISINNAVSLKKLLTRMNVIKPLKKKNIKEDIYDCGFEQLMLDI
ncbi:hypothetical protein [Romboutsia ilealis]|uniref:hypothetical protein n=2 Tax=Clostridia TaxID=186801 RepID=UPI002494AC1A|nr:hypothetical protein [Romboutsia ilealis]